MLAKIIKLTVLISLTLVLAGCTYQRSISNNQKAQVQVPVSPTLNSDIKPSLNLPSTSNDTSAEKFPPEVPVLYYHSIMQEANNEIRMPPEQFEEQVAYLSSHGYHSITPTQLYESLYRNGVLPQKPFLLTFDDGYADNYYTAFPILKKYGYVATVFMISGCIGQKGFLTWPQLKELSANGWDIADHTQNHSYLTKLAPLPLLSELRNSKNTLEKGLGYSVDYFAYPYGDFNDKVVQAVKKAGFRMAFTTLRGWADSHRDTYHVHRVYCYSNMGMKEFIRRIQDPNY